MEHHDCPGKAAFSDIPRKRDDRSLSSLSREKYVYPATVVAGMDKRILFGRRFFSMTKFLS